MLAVASNAANLRLLEAFLEVHAGSVQAFSAPADIARQPNPSDPPNMAVVDVDGFDDEIWTLVDRLNAADVPVVILTKYRTEQIQAATLTHPVRAVLEKPVRKAQLQAIVETLAS